MKRRQRKKFLQINFQAITWLPTTMAIFLWLGLGMFTYFISPKNNLIIASGFLLFLAALFSTATLIFKNWQQSLILSGGIITLFLLQFFSLLTLPIFLTTAILIALTLFYFSFP